ncbi:MAG: hypothetical protein RIS79_3701, partial [Verrucomicrobiota bacterium]
MKAPLTALLLASSFILAADPAAPITQNCTVDKLISAEAFDKPESFAKE